jgi:hypothetical protein
VQQSSALLDTSLEHAAELLGDITAPVMARFYDVHPEARRVFEYHGLLGREKLEAEMVQNALYWTMTWLEHDKEIRIHLGNSVPHHEETLKVPSRWYRGLVDAVIDVIAETIPADHLDALELWKRIREGLGGAIDHSKPILMPRPSAAI